MYDDKGGGVHISAENTTNEWDAPVRRRRGPRPVARGDGPPTFEVAVEVMLRRSAWASRTQVKAREILLAGRFRRFCEAHGVRLVADLTDDHLAEYLAGLREAGLAPNTVVKTRQVFIAFQRFCSATPGYGGQLTEAVGRMAMPRVPEHRVEVLTTADEVRVVKACRHERDRLLVEVMLLTGVRVGELVSLRVEDVHIEDRRPYLHVRRSVGEEMTKSGRDRIVPLDWAGGTLSRRLGRYLAVRPQSHRLEVFLSHRGDVYGDHAPLTADGVRRMLVRLGEDTGLRLHPHLFRHTWATRAVEAGVPTPLIQEAGGWRSLTMLNRYVTRNREAMLDAFARAHRGG